MDDDFTLANESQDGSVIVLQYRGEGFVSIDLKRRIWELGWATQPRRMPPEMRGRYTGRDWGKRLEADARAALKAIYEEKKK